MHQACVASIISAYQDGGRIIEKIKKKRDEKRGMQPPRLLEESIDQAPEEIEREKSRGIQRFGKAFEEGDHIAIIALQRITIEIQQSLLEQLRDAAYDDDVTDFMSLVDAADSGRDRTISTLLDLRQRLLQAAPINEMSRMSVGSRTSTSGSLSQVFQPPGQTSQSRELGPDQAPAHRQVMKHRRTLTPDTASSGYMSSVEDTTSGAEDNQKKHAGKSRNKSLFNFLGHSRTSGDQVAKSQPPQELARQTSGPNANTPFKAPAPCDVREDAASSRSGSTAKPPSTSDNGSVRSGSIAEPKYTYEEGEDNPFEIWGNKRPAGPERKDTQVAPDSIPAMSRQSTYTSLAPSTTSFASTRTFSNAGSIIGPGGRGTSGTSTAIPHPSAENNYLGFCKGAWKLQNGDRKGVNTCKDFRYSAQAGVYYLACSGPKCAFAGHYNPKVIWDKVWIDQAKGLKFRWPFLAKSHVAQKVVKQDTYAYQCLFCAYLGRPTPVLHGMELYLAHVAAEHRGPPLSDVVLYKCGAVAGREADDAEDFDINLLPLSAEEAATRRRESGFAADGNGGPMMASDLKRSDTIAKDSMFSNEPWNEGLSDFHYGGNNEFDYTSMSDFRTAELEG